jgi:hypothetical protein
MITKKNPDVVCTASPVSFASGSKPTGSALGSLIQPIDTIWNFLLLIYLSISYIYVNRCTIEE